MAKQTGIIKLKGKIGDLSFYKSKDGHLAREKGGVEAERIKNDPAFVRTRENNAEFGSSASAGKFSRDSLRPIALTASDNRVVARMTKLMTQIKNLDGTSVRGLRNVGVAMALATAKAKLKGFEFNKNALIGSILYKPWSLNVSVVSGDMLEPVLPGTLYRIIGRSVYDATNLKCSIIPFCIGLL